MRKIFEMLIIFLIGIVFLLIMSINAKNYDNSQNKTQSTSNDNLYYQSEN